MSVSPEKLAANRANAKLSTGPVTPEGKARVSKNALRHGFTAREIIVRDDERDQFETLLAELHHEVQPQGAIENELFEQLLHAAWNLRRVRRLEAELFSGSADPLTDDALEAKLTRYARYAARFERTFHRALRELKHIQTARALHAQWAEATGQMVPILIDILKAEKQSQNLFPQEPIIQFRLVDPPPGQPSAAGFHLDPPPPFPPPAKPVA